MKEILCCIDCYILLIVINICGKRAATIKAFHRHWFTNFDESVTAMTIKVNYVDVENENEKLGKEEWQLTKRLGQLQARRRLLKKVLNQNEEGQKKWIVEVPQEALPHRNENKKRIDWKKHVLEMFQKYDLPMSTELLCNKIWLHFPEVPLNRRVVIQNVSSALSALQGSDQKLFRTRIKTKKGFIYGLKHFFNFDLELKPKHLIDWMREEGEEEDLIEATVTEIKKMKEAKKPVAVQ